MAKVRMRDRGECYDGLIVCNCSMLDSRNQQAKLTDQADTDARLLQGGAPVLLTTMSGVVHDDLFSFPLPLTLPPARQHGLAGQGLSPFWRHPLPPRLCGLAGDFLPALRRQPGRARLPALPAFSDEVGALPWGQAEFHDHQYTFRGKQWSNSFSC